MQILEEWDGWLSREWGFSRTMDYIRQLNIKGKIPLKVRSEWEGKICDMYVNM